MSMVEKVAEAIYNKYMENLIGCCEPAWNELQPDHKERLIESARAGIEALRVPTDKMMQISNLPTSGFFNKDIWGRMIDEALKDE